jgi:hypothetical protein
MRRHLISRGKPQDQITFCSLEADNSQVYLHSHLCMPASLKDTACILLTCIDRCAPGSGVDMPLSIPVIAAHGKTHGKTLGYRVTSNAQRQ